MLRDVVVHINNEQPIMVDLVGEPSASDVTLICRNVRTMAGKKPVFVDKIDSTFMIPLAHVRFVEMPLESVRAHEEERAGGQLPRLEAGVSDRAGTPLDRPAWPAPDAGEREGPTGGCEGEGGEREGEAGHLGSPIGGDRAEPDGETAGGDGRVDRDGLDPDLLRRIREA
jgi:hypothetical protein